MEQLSTSPQSGADILRPIFICKLVRSGVNADDLLEEYKLALKGMPRGAVIRTVDKIRTGMLCQANNFCPLPPELASLVREEWRMQRLLDAPLALPAPSKSSMQTQMEKRWQGQHVLLEGITHDNFIALSKQGKVPIGAIHVPILGKVFSAPHPEFFGEKEAGSQSPVVRKFRQQRDEEDRAYYRTQEIHTDEERAYWKRINALRDKPELTADQVHFRDQVEAQLGHQ